MGTSTFGPVAQPTLTLSPAAGDSKTLVTAAIRTFGACGDGRNQTEVSIPVVSVLWDDTPQTPSSIAQGDIDLTVKFPVPAGASAGEHHVTARCGQSTTAPATFTLSAPDNPPEKPSLTVSPAQGAATTPVTAIATGFGTCQAMSFRWDDATLPTTPVGGDPLVVTFAVPKDAPAGAHQVTASCANTDVKFSSRAGLIISPPATFTVTAPEHPALALTPAQGGAATPATATATGFGACQAMSWRWEDATLPTTPVAGDPLVVTFVVPRDAPAGAHHVTATCGDASAPATFTVVPTPIPSNPALALTPAQGTLATPVTATATGFGACQAMSFRWDDDALATTPVGSNALVVSFTVPKDAPAGAHHVTATCGGASAPATFTVVSAAKPALTLDTGHGPGGAHLTASGTGFACGDGNVQLLWERATPLAEASSGMFSAVPLTIPSDASTGSHMVVASCEHHPDIADGQRFTVTSVPTSVTTAGPAALTLQPTSGHPGDQLRATGDGFACANHSGPVDLSWDDGTALPGASLDRPGHFEASVLVPAKTDARRLTLSAACPDGVVLAADFTLLASPTPPPPPPMIPWLLIVLVLAGAMVAAAEYARRRHKRPKAPPHIAAVPRPGGLPIVTVRETPELGEATHALRLETRSGASTLTVREVDR